MTRSMRVPTCVLANSGVQTAPTVGDLPRRLVEIASVTKAVSAPARG
ncbi:hypothetical protein [Streptomyces decoyicus]